MRLSVALVIFRKEMIETLRDRRALMSLVFLPMLLYALLMLLMSKLAGAEMEALQAKPSQVAVWGELPEDIEKALKEEGKLELLPWAGAPDSLRKNLEAGAIPPPEPPPLASPEPPGKKGPNIKKEPEKRPDEAVVEAVRAISGRREVDAVLVPWRGFADDVRGGRAGRISIYYDSVRGDSEFASDRLDAALSRARVALLKSREDARGMPPGFTEALTVTSRNVAPEERRVGKFLGSIMPMMLILMSLLGGFLRAADMTAGEKERGTMQTLLCAPLLPIEIITGKFLAVFAISLVTALVNVSSMALTLRRVLPGEMDVPVSAHVLTFVLLLPVSFLFSALFLAVASFARDFKDAQNLLTPLYLPIMLLSMLTSLPGMELSVATSFVPLLNVALLIKAIYLGDVAPDLVLFTLGSSILFAALALVFAARVFEREDVLLGDGRSSFRAMLTWKRQKGGAPSLAFSLGGFAVILVVMFYASVLLEKTTNLTVQLVASQIGLFFAPPLIAIALSGASFRETFGLRLPPTRALVGAVLAGISAGVVVAAFAMRLVPVPKEFSEKLNETLLLHGKPLWVLLLLIAVLPAICEETLFRGFLFAGLRRAGPALAIVASSLLFGLAHGSIYRFLPTAMLGALLACARLWTGSLLPGMIMHALNNGLVMVLLATRPAWASRFLDGDQVPVWLGAIAAVVLIGGILLLRSPDKRAEER